MEFARFLCVSILAVVLQVNYSFQACTDISPNCKSWAFRGQCQKNPRYMERFCKESCRLCGTASNAKTWEKGDQLEAEGFFVFDRKALELYLREEGGDVERAKASMLQDFEFWANDVNAFYKTLERFGMKMRLMIVDVQVLDYDLITANDIVLPPKEVNPNTFLTAFSSFVNGDSRFGQPKRFPNEYDFAMLLSGYELRGAVTGFAATGEVCNEGRANGIVEWTGKMDASGVIAHELGHILGALHDRPDAVTVMTPVGKNTNDPAKYTFSQKSYNDIRDHILKVENTLGDNCLLTTRRNSRLPSTTPYKYTGKAQNPNTVCQRATFPGSSPCVNPSYYKPQNDKTNTPSISGEDICNGIFCHKEQNSNYCERVRPTEGMACATGKSCIKGLCVDDPRPRYRNIPSNCVFGDDKEPTPGQTCESVLKTWGNGPQSCNNTFNAQCCETCAKYATGDPSCPYGDVYVLAFSGGIKMTCSEAIDRQGAEYICGQLHHRCCKTCAELEAKKGIDKNCPWGDDKLIKFNGKSTTCNSVFHEYGYKEMCGRNGFLKKQCCGTCHRNKNACFDLTSIKINGQKTTCPATIDEYGIHMVCVGNPRIKDRCCESCDAAAKSHGHGPACPYGDDAYVNIGSSRMTCGSAYSRYGRKYVCVTSKYLAARCCSTCITGS